MQAVLVIWKFLRKKNVSTNLLMQIKDVSDARYYFSVSDSCAYKLWCFVAIQLPCFFAWKHFIAGKRFLLGSKISLLWKWTKTKNQLLLVRIKRLFLFNVKLICLARFWIESEKCANTPLIVNESFMPFLMRVLIDANCLDHTNSVGIQFCD